MLFGLAQLVRTSLQAADMLYWLLTCFTRMRSQVVRTSLLQAGGVWQEKLIIQETGSLVFLGRFSQVF
jgi:hypothetical protein